MRELRIAELEYVSGGVEAIVVTGNRASNNPYGGDSLMNIMPASMTWASSYGNYLNYMGGGGWYLSRALDQISSTALVDTNGDGIPDSPEIVVVASMTSAQANALYNTYWTVGGGDFGVVGGLFGSQATGLGFYVGVGTPELSAEVGVATDASGLLKGLSVHSAPVGLGGIGGTYSPGSPGNAAASFGTIGWSATYGVTFADATSSAARAGVAYEQIRFPF